MSDLHLFTQAYWDERYAQHDHVWSGRANPQLMAHVDGLTPDTAIDVGCGEGGDAIWLARQGWTVTGADVSPVGLRKAQAHAEREGLQITWRQIDLYAPEMEPLGTYALVSSQYLHMPPSVRDLAVARLAAAVGPGGCLLLVSHHPRDLAVPGLRPNRPEMFYTAEDLVPHFNAREWEILAADASARAASHREGRPVTVYDTVLFARRRG
jgi:SAM-dependent methyltransferase